MFRKSIDGGIWVPKHGPRIPAPVGFTVGSMWNHFYKILNTCDKREVINTIKKSCGCKREEWWCNTEENKTQVSRVRCELCQADWWKSEYPDAVDYTK